MAAYELTLTQDGQASLSIDAEVTWSSDGDPDFEQEFPEQGPMV